MAKITQKIHEYRLDGARWILDYAKSNGFEAAEFEIKRRGGKNFIPFEVPTETINNFVEYTRNNVLDTVMLMTACVLRDEFDFGEKRIKRFIDRFDIKVDSLIDKYVTWNDLKETMQEEIGIDFHIGNDLK